VRDLLAGATGGRPWPAGAGTTATITAETRIARRYLLKEAVFGGPPQHVHQPPQDVHQPPQHLHHEHGQPTVSPGVTGPGRRPARPRAVTGRVLDASPQVLVIGHGDAEERFALTAGARAWRGAKTDPAAIKAGDHVVVRRHGSGRERADRIWANIGRVTGKIIRREGDALLVDGGDGAGQRVVVIGTRAAGQIQVRFPRLQPGYLIDVIGIRHVGYLEGLVPATSQPPYRSDHVPPPPLISGHLPGAISGAASWHEPGPEPDGLAGLAYPAVDQHATGPAADGPAGPTGCVSLPYLSIGSVLRVRNDCTDRSVTLPVIGCAAIARLFCDRSVSCGPSPRGRIADLTLASFVELGGELDEGSFNATIEIGG
jgi:hypothetical protein